MLTKERREYSIVALDSWGNQYSTYIIVEDDSEEEARHCAERWACSESLDVSTLSVIARN